MKNHHGWYVNPPSKPTRKEYGLPDASIINQEQMKAAMSMVEKKMDGWAIDYSEVEPATKVALDSHIAKYMTEVAAATGYTADDKELKWISAAKHVGLSENYTEMMYTERAYRSAKKHYKSYIEWKKNRNPVRAKLEQKFGYDTKHGGHVVRLLRMAKEILTEHKVIVRRPDAEELVSIRRGAWSYDQMIEWAEKEEANLNILMKESTLPSQPDRETLDIWFMNTISNWIKEH